MCSISLKGLSQLSVAFLSEHFWDSGRSVASVRLGQILGPPQACSGVSLVLSVAAAWLLGDSLYLTGSGSQCASWPFWSQGKEEAV